MPKNTEVEPAVEPEVEVAPAPEPTATGRTETVVDTKTFVEDFTDHEVRDLYLREATVTKRTLDDGTVIEDYT